MPLPNAAPCSASGRKVKKDSRNPLTLELREMIFFTNPGGSVERPRGKLVPVFVGPALGGYYTQKVR